MQRPLVSVIIPAFNEAAIIAENLGVICDYLETLEDRYRWELIVVNDGSTDETGMLINEFAADRPNVTALHHAINFQLGQALRYAFNNASGDYFVTFDADLSYDPPHIARLVDEMVDSHAKVVIASPYMAGGETTKVPWLRKTMSRWANRILSATAKGKLTTITGMVRAYDAPFLKSLNLKTVDAEINPEIIYKAQILRAHIVEIPAHLDWSFKQTGGKRRKSAVRMSRSVASSTFSAFLFRPFMFFIVPGLIVIVLALYSLGWAAFHVGSAWGDATSFSDAVAVAYADRPHSFIIGGIGLILAFQLLSLGFIAVQNKRYFEELFHLGTSITRQHQAPLNPTGELEAQPVGRVLSDDE
ncbi:MAG: glycosyltransferase family 2 protein [Acidimicrobiia bacterium]|nr:glycosyltransferase family 2 protein [Acidimicrobiia bacterium]